MHIKTPDANAIAMVYFVSLSCAKLEACPIRPSETVTRGTARPKVESRSFCNSTEPIAAAAAASGVADAVGNVQEFPEQIRDHFR